MNVVKEWVATSVVVPLPPGIYPSRDESDSQTPEGGQIPVSSILDSIFSSSTKIDAASEDRLMWHLLGTSAPLNPFALEVTGSSTQAEVTGSSTQATVQYSEAAEHTDSSGKKVATVWFARTPHDHAVHRLPGTEENAALGYVIVTYVKEYDISAVAFGIVEFDDSVDIKIANGALSSVKAGVSVASGGFAVGGTSGGDGSAYAPSTTTTRLPKVQMVRTRMGPESGDDRVVHFAHVHLAVSVLRQERAIVSLENALGVMRSSRSSNVTAFRWGGLFSADALTDLTHIGSAVSSIRAEIWFDFTCGWEEGAASLAGAQESRGLSSRLRNIEQTVQSWSSSLELLRAVSQQEEAERADTSRDNLNQMVAGIATAGFVVASAALFPQQTQQASFGVLSIVLAVLMGTAAWLTTRYAQGAKAKRMQQSSITASMPTAVAPLNQGQHAEYYNSPRYGAKVRVDLPHDRQYATPKTAAKKYGRRRISR